MKKILLVIFMLYLFWAFSPYIISFSNNVMNIITSLIKAPTNYTQQTDNTNIDFNTVKENITNKIKGEKTIQKVTNTRDNLNKDVENVLDN